MCIYEWERNDGMYIHAVFFVNSSMMKNTCHMFSVNVTLLTDRRIYPGPCRSMQCLANVAGAETGQHWSVVARWKRADWWQVFLMLVVNGGPLQWSTAGVWMNNLNVKHLCECLNMFERRCPTTQFLSNDPSNSWGLQNSWFTYMQDGNIWIYSMMTYE